MVHACDLLQLTEILCNTLHCFKMFLYCTEIDIIFTLQSFHKITCIMFALQFFHKITLISGCSCSIIAGRGWGGGI